MTPTPQAGPQTASATPSQPSSTSANKEVVTSSGASPQVQAQQRGNESSFRCYYATKISEAEQLLAEKMQNVRRLHAQRNELNNKVCIERLQNSIRK